MYRIYEDLNAIAVVGVGKETNDPSSDVYKRLESLAHSGKLADTVLRTLRLFSSPGEPRTVVLKDNFQRVTSVASAARSFPRPRDTAVFRRLR